MNTDRALRAYQAYSLTKISELNKQTLIAQYAQCEQLNQLNKEMAAANATSNKILQNQVNELKRQEKVRYFKNLAFNLKQILSKIEEQSNENFKRFLGGLFLGPIDLFAKDCSQNLEDIQDKEYAASISAQANSLLKSLNLSSPDFESSAWNRYLIAQNKLNAIDLESTEMELSKLKAHGLSIPEKQSVGYGIWGLLFYAFSGLAGIEVIGSIGASFSEGNSFTDFIILILLTAAIWWLLFRKYKKVKSAYKQKFNDHDTLVKTKEAQTEMLNASINEANAELAAAEGTLYAELPSWHDILESIGSLLPEVKSNNDMELDRYFKDAASLAISRDKIDSAYIQKKLGLSYTRARKLLSQMEVTKIVGPEKKSGSHEVLCHDMAAVDAVIKRYE